MTLALDSIIDFQELVKEPFFEESKIDFDHYFDDLIGVTKTENEKAQKVVLYIDNYNAPYVLTKPMHPSQTLFERRGERYYNKDRRNSEF